MVPISSRPSVSGRCGLSPLAIGTTDRVSPMKPLRRFLRTGRCGQVCRGLSRRCGGVLAHASDPANRPRLRPVSFGSSVAINGRLSPGTDRAGTATPAIWQCDRHERRRDQLDHDQEPEAMRERRAAASTCQTRGDHARTVAANALLNRVCTRDSIAVGLRGSHSRHQWPALDARCRRLSLTCLNKRPRHVVRTGIMHQGID